MKINFYGSFCLYCIMHIYGCKINSKDKTENATLQQNKMDSSKVQFYARGSGSNNGWETYYDELAITNYRNNSMTLQQFYTIARHYIDTVKARLPVSAVAFLGQKPGKLLPSASDDFYMDERKKLHIIVFEFDNAFKETAGKKAPAVLGISIMHNGEYLDFPSYPDFSKNPYIERHQLDSLLNCTVPLDTGFGN